MSSHLLYDSFAYAETEASASWVCILVFCEISKVDENAIQFVFWDTASKVLN